jgi:hypothetical protein
MDTARSEYDEMSGKISDAASRASEEMNRLTDTASAKMREGLEYLRSRNLTEIGDDTQELVRRYPGVSMLAAAAIGFLTAHYILRSTSQSRQML